MNKVLGKLPALVQEELEAANEVNPPFHSLHEGWAVIEEEFEEAQERVTSVEAFVDALWHYVRLNNADQVKQHAKLVVEYADLAVAELIQTAAMAQKLLAYIEEVNANG